MREHPHVTRPGRNCVLAFNILLSMLIMDNHHKLDRILRSTNLDEYELIDLPMEQQSGDSSHEHTGIGMALTSDTRSTSGLAPLEGSSKELLLGFDQCHGPSMPSSPIVMYMYVLYIYLAFLLQK